MTVQDAHVKRNYHLPACLIIMDGYGLAPAGPGNAISLARTPVLDFLFETYPALRLEASGQAVGLPDAQMGNSEVGHLNIGAGRVVFQELTRINNACRDNSIRSNKALSDAFAQARKQGAVLHFMGLLSDGGVHSSNEHLYALLRAARDAGVQHVMIHCFMDGRDVPPSSGKTYLADLLREIHDLECAPGQSDCLIEIASIEGRYYAMDRDKRWERVKRAYDAIVCAKGIVAQDPLEAIEASYASGVTDEFVEPIVLSERGMRDGDAVVFFNFRPDRAREITRAMVDEDFNDFIREKTCQLSFVCLTEYDPDIFAPVAFKKEFPEMVLADVLASRGLSQYHIAETEKYAHVTFFLNGGLEEEKVSETRKLIPSPKVATYDLKPEMSAPEVAEVLVSAISADEADVYIVNFANCDMVGHTGIISAAVKAVEAVDAALGRVLSAMHDKGGVTLITADHGNADKMIAEDGGPHTAHTTACVPLILVDESGTGHTLQKVDNNMESAGCLADVAPTFLAAIGIPVPTEMTGKTLLA